MSGGASPLVVSIRQPYAEALRRFADSMHMGDGQAAAHLLSIALEPYLEAATAEQARAEREILKVAEELAREEAGRSGWNEHLTLAVFEKIEAGHLPLYQRASAGDQQRQLNRRIGRRVKEAVGASVKLESGKPVVVHAPRSSRGLIQRYTLLTRP